MNSDDALRRRYGRHAEISRKGAFVLVHLDHPTVELVESRTASFDPDEFFDAECPLCATARASGIVVFDASEDSAHAEEEILLE